MKLIRTLLLILFFSQLGLATDVQRLGGWDSRSLYKALVQAYPSLVNCPVSPKPGEVDCTITFVNLTCTNVGVEMCSVFRVDEAGNIVGDPLFAIDSTKLGDEFTKQTSKQKVNQLTGVCGKKKARFPTLFDGYACDIYKY